MRLLEESETEMHPRYERLCQEMIALTCHPGPHTAESLARRMFRNKQQIQSDLRWWQGMLEVSGLSLSVGRQITVEGPEWTIRGLRAAAQGGSPRRARARAAGRRRAAGPPAWQIPSDEQ